MRKEVCIVSKCYSSVSTKKRGLCHAHAEWSRKHDWATPTHRVNRAPHAPIEERILRRTYVEREKGCIIWTGAVSGFGYGKINVDGDLLYVHRLAYEFAHGPVPEGLVVDHRCNEKRCVNPDHLEAVTTYENLRRGNEFRRFKARGEDYFAYAMARGENWESREHDDWAGSAFPLSLLPSQHPSMEV